MLQNDLGTGHIKFEMPHFKVKTPRFKLGMLLLNLEMPHFRFEMPHFNLEMFHHDFEMPRFKFKRLYFNLEIQHFKSVMRRPDPVISRLPPQLAGPGFIPALNQFLLIRLIEYKSYRHKVLLFFMLAIFPGLVSKSLLSPKKWNRECDHGQRTEIWRNLEWD